MRIPLPIIQKIYLEPCRDHLHITNGGNIVTAERYEWTQNETAGVSYDMKYYTEGSLATNKFNENDIINSKEYNFIVEKIICSKWYKIKVINSDGLKINEDYYSERDLIKLKGETSEF